MNLQQELYFDHLALVRRGEEVSHLVHRRRVHPRNHVVHVAHAYHALLETRKQVIRYARGTREAVGKDVVINRLENQRGDCGCAGTKTMACKDNTIIGVRDQLLVDERLQNCYHFVRLFTHARVNKTSVETARLNY